MTSEVEAFYKIILVGDFGVGKTSLLLKYADNSFKEGELVTTIGSDFKTKDVALANGKSVRLQLWDTAGQEKFRTITSSFYRATHGILFVYDITNADSFESIKQWYREIDRYASDNINKVLVANKADLEAQRAVKHEDAKQYADSLEMAFFEASAKSGKNVDECFLHITNQIYKRTKGMSRSKTLHLGSSRQNTNDEGCKC